uniref:Uncharacterized protein n=1 Tax=Tetraodon nigroviridis TaxID=99883 RepID=H3CKQ2_TETNG
MADLAGPVLADIDVVCHSLDLETHQEPLEEPAKVSCLLLLDNVPAPSVERSALEDVFSPQPSTEQPNQVSPSCDIMEVFSIQAPTQSLGNSQPNQPASPQPKFTNAQILSIFPQHPVGGSPYSPPPYPPSVLAWGQPGLPGNQWPGQAAGPWPSMPAGVGAHSGVRPEAGGFHPGVMNGGVPPHTRNPTQVHPPNNVPDFLQ